MSAQIPHDALVVVADGGRAIIFRNKATDLAKPALVHERHLTPADFSGQGPSGSRPDDQTVKQTAHATFIKELAQTLHTELGQGKFAHLVVVADPTSLGEFRAAAHKTLDAAIVKTLSKDLTHQSPDEIATALIKP